MPNRARRIGPGAQFPRVQSLEIGGKLYILLPIEEYEDLREKAERPREDTSPLGAESVGRDLRSRRHRARMTLSEVASKAGIAAETLSRIETGKTNPSVRTVRSILRALTSGGQP
jgi:DNA-binding XRE family transcriptional regulator